MSTKVCFKCLKEKDLNDFYKHSKMSDGRVNKCKECNKNDVRNNYIIKSEDINYILKERERNRLKYQRLNYKEKQKVWDIEKPWKKTATYKNLHRKFKCQKGIELHHWNYNKEYLEDIFFLNVKSHKKLHTNLVFDKETLMFRTLDNQLLDTKIKHEEFMKNLGIC